MIRKVQSSDRTVSGLRTRYFPKSRIGQGLVSVAPWVDVVLLVIIFAILDPKLVLQPGIVIEPPEMPLMKGVRSGLIAVVLSVRSEERGSREEIVYFDDARFLVKHEDQMQDLEEAFATQAGRPDAILVIQADRHVRHGTIVRLWNMAAQAGIKKVSVGSRYISNNGG